MRNSNLIDDNGVKWAEGSVKVWKSPGRCNLCRKKRVAHQMTFSPNGIPMGPVRYYCPDSKCKRGI